MIIKCIIKSWQWYYIIAEKNIPVVLLEIADDVI